MYDPADKEFWLGSLAGHQIHVEESTWYSEGGEENYGGGFHRWSKRYKELTLKGPYAAEKLLINVEARRAFSTKDYSWPVGRVAHLTPPWADFYRSAFGSRKLVEIWKSENSK